MKRKLIIIVACGLMAFGLANIQSKAVQAASFDPARIIDDSVFYNSSAMSVQQIQDFLNSKVPNCDTNGVKMYGGMTRAAYAQSRGDSTPFTCLKSYYENPSTHATNLYGGAIPSGAISAAQIIYNSAQQYQINPQVLIVTLQKEQGLITDDWPMTYQYRSAMGYGCPDTAACDSQYYGFYNQVNNAAWQFRRYATFPNQYNYVPGPGNFVRYNPNAACGGTMLNIQNQATASLYNYTPYQPNASALAAGYGSGDSCSAYGNRNFWLYFNDWFGSTTFFNGNIILSQGLTVTPGGPTYEGQSITASYKVKNTASFDIYAGGLGICGRSNGQYYDFGYADQNLIPANSEITISYTKTLDRPGSLYLFTCSYHASIGGWASSFYPYATSAITRSASLTVQNNPLITSGITLSPASPAAGQPVTATMSIQNNSASPINLGTITVAARDPYGGNVDFPTDTNITIQANSTYVYSKTRIFTTSGDHSLFVADLRNGIWVSNYPYAANSSVVRNATVRVQDNPLIVSSVNFSPASPAAGQPVTASVSIRNNSPTDLLVGGLVVAARDPNGANVDFPGNSSLIIPANSTLVFSKTRTLTTAGKYTFFIANFRNNTWNSTYPKSSDSSLVRQGTLQVQDNPLITSGITFSASPTAGQPVTATVTIRNASASDVNIGLFVIAGRSPSGSNVDFPTDASLTIPAGTTITYSKTRTFATSGTYSFFLADFIGGTWYTNYPRSFDSSVIRQRSLTIL